MNSNNSKYRKDINGVEILTSIRSFFNNEKKRKNKTTSILTLISDQQMEYLGGLGKTYETRQFIKTYNKENELNLDLIDLSEDKDKYGILEDVFINLQAQANPLTKTGEFPDFKEFQRVYDLNRSPKAMLIKSLSELAERAFHNTFEHNEIVKDWKKQPFILIFDSLDWLIDEEILHIRKTEFKPPERDPQKVLEETTLSKASLFFWLTKIGGVFDVLTNAGVTLLVTCRYDLRNIALKDRHYAIRDKINRTLEVGAFNEKDLKIFLESHKEDFPNKKLPEELTLNRLKSVVDVSDYRPVLAILIANYITTQYRKYKSLGETLWHEIDEALKIPDRLKRYKDLLKYFIEDLDEVTGSFLSAKIVKYLTMAYYRLDVPMLSHLLSLSDPDFSEKKVKALIDKQISKLSLVKSYPYKNSPQDQILFLRPHDDIIGLFHSYWEEDEIVKDSWNSPILKYYEQKRPWETVKNNDSLRKNLELYYLTYLFEAVKDKTDLEAASRFAQFIFIENIDEHPDQAERILSKVEIYLPFERESPFPQHIDASPFREWLALRRVEYCLTERSKDNMDLAKKRLKVLEKSIEEDSKKLGSLTPAVEGYYGELAIWENEFTEARNHLENSAGTLYIQNRQFLLAWILHLQGFIANRTADFENSDLYNTAAIEIIMPYLYKKALEYAENSESTETLFSQDKRETYRFRRLLRVFLRSVGNLAALRRYKGELFLTVKYSYLQIYIWETVPYADREIARTYANLLIGVNNMELDELSNNLGVFAGAEWLQEFEKDPLIELRLIYARTLHGFKRGGFGYVNAHLPGKLKFEAEKVVKVSNRLASVNRALEIITNGMEERKLPLGEPLPPKEKDHRTWRREIGELYYLKGKIHLQTLKNGKTDYQAANQAFENALEVAERCDFQYLKMLAMEALTALAAFQWHKDPQRNNPASFEARQDKFERFLRQGAPAYADVMGKYQNTKGNVYFQEAQKIMQSQEADKREKAKQKLVDAINAYCLMLDYNFKHNRDRYEIAQKVIASRIGDLYFNRRMRSLISDAYDAFLQALKTTEAVRRDPYLNDYVESLFKMVGLLSGFEDTSVLEEAQRLQRTFEFRGMTRKSMEIARLIVQYYRQETNQNPTDYSILQTILSYYRLIYLFQHLNQDKKALGVVSQAQAFLAEKGKTNNALLNAIIAIAEITAKYRTSEFWAIERFVRGEEKYYEKRHPDFINFSEQLKNAIYTIVESELCQNPEAVEFLPLIRILSDGCFRLGELFLIIDRAESALISATDKKIFKSIDAILHAYDKQSKESNYQAMIKHIEEGGSPYLERARGLARLIHDIPRQSNILESILNHWYLKIGGSAKKAEDLDLLIYTTKAYCLDFSKLVRIFQSSFSDEKEINPSNLDVPPPKLKEIKSLYKFLDESIPKGDYTRQELNDWYSKNITDEKRRFDIKEKLSKYVRFLPIFRTQLFSRNEYESPFVYAKLKMILGNEIFSRYFEPNPDIYEKITDQLKGEKSDEGKLLLEKCKLTKTGNSWMESTKNSNQLGEDMRTMFKHYLEGLDVLNSTLPDSFEFNNYLLEIQRRILLIPEKQALLEIEENLGTSWNLFPRLSRNLNIQKEIAWTLKMRIIALCLEEIYKA